MGPRRKCSTLKDKQKTNGSVDDVGRGGVTMLLRPECRAQGTLRTLGTGFWGFFAVVVVVFFS